MISRYIVKGNIKARHQVFKIIRRQVTTGKDQMDSLTFFSEKILFEKRSFYPIAHCKNFHKLLYSYYGEHIIVCIEHNKEGCTRLMRSFLM